MVKDDYEAPTAPVMGKNGKPRYPERSIYYDKVFNPYGVPPPGMPYKERRELCPDLMCIIYG